MNYNGVIEQVMKAYGWTDLWYIGDDLLSRPSWLAGVWTGPDNDLICLQHCETNEEAEQYLSPAGWSIAEALHLAIEKRLSLAQR